MRHPAVAGFCWDHGIELGFDAPDTARWLANLCVGDHPGDADARHDAGRPANVVDAEETIVSADPLRVRVTIRYEGDTLRLTCDEDLNVVDVTQRAASDPV